MERGPDQQVRLASGQRIGFVQCGDPRGAPLLYFHGWPGSARQALLADRIGKERGWNILALDRPGLGFSEPIPGFELDDWPPLVNAVLDLWGWEHCHLLAVSGGAPTAHACVADAPHRFHRLGLCSGAPPIAELPHTRDLFPVFRLLLASHRRWPSLSPTLLSIFDNYLELRDDTTAMRPWIPLLPRPDREALGQPETARCLTASMRSAFRQGPWGIMADGESLLRPWNFDWRHPQVPLDFWHGAQDRTLPLGMARWTWRQIAGKSTFREFAAEGHYSLPLRRLGEILQSWPV